jgi:hypothetical protein
MKEKSIGSPSRTIPTNPRSSIKTVKDGPTSAIESEGDLSGYSRNQRKFK